MNLLVAPRQQTLFYCQDCITTSKDYMCMLLLQPQQLYKGIRRCFITKVNTEDQYACDL
jgi:hypothetical protein